MSQLRMPLAIALMMVLLSANRGQCADRPLAVVNQTPVPVYITLLNKRSAATGVTRYTGKKLGRQSNDRWELLAKDRARLVDDGNAIMAEAATFVVRLHAYDRCDTYREYTVDTPTGDLLVFEITPQIIADTYESLASDMHGVCRSELGGFGYGPQLAPYVVESRVMRRRTPGPRSLHGLPTRMPLQKTGPELCCGCLRTCCILRTLTMSFGLLRNAAG